MRLKNYTDIETERIREIIRFVKPSGIGGFDVRISNTKRYRFAGRAYMEGSDYHDRDCPFIVVRIGGKGWDYPYKSCSYGIILSKEEILVMVIAHELRHLWQYKHKKGKVWGAKGRFSERDADAYAIRKVREWRRLNYER
jgi:hypothetical protein